MFCLLSLQKNSFLCFHSKLFFIPELFLRGVVTQQSESTLMGILPDCWKVSSVAPMFKNVGERSTAENYCPVNLLCVASKVFQKFVNNRLVDNLEKSGLFSDFQYGFRSSQSTTDLLTVASHRIARALTGLRLPKLQHLIYPKLLTELGMLVFFTNLGLIEFQIRYFVLFLLFSVIGGFGWLWKKKKKKKLYGPYLWMGVNYHFEEAVYILLLSSQRFLVLILSISKG